MSKFLVITALSASMALASGEPRFQAARPVWPEGRTQEKNITVGFRAMFFVEPDEPVVFRVAACSLYRAFLNGEFIGQGPARGPHGYYRVDQIDLTGKTRPGSNILALEAVAYNVNSFYLLDEPGFLQAEVESGGRILACTGGAGPQFDAFVITDRVQKVQRYSFQRPFIEVYSLKEGYDRWRSEVTAEELVTCEILPDKNLLPRRVGYPAFELRSPISHVCSGRLKTTLPESYWKDRSLTDIGPKLGGFKEADLEIVVSKELQQLANETAIQLDRPMGSDEQIHLESLSYHILDFGTNLTGMLGVDVNCTHSSRLYLVFDEVLRNQDVDFKRLGCVNAITWDLTPGRYRLESIEPYTLRYCKLVLSDGQCEIEGVHLREYANPDIWQAHFACSDVRLNKLFAAGRETFRQNAVDIFMDCPSRERAGWLCDSYFTSRVAPKLSGHCAIEKNFYENFLLPEKFEFLPEGMLPMCYPSDHNDGAFIPNWALWFVVELEEYLARSGDREMVDALRPRVEKLFEYFRPFENSDGLLEKLQSWVFVEWSEANKFVQDVNYPTNMLYAGALAAAGRMYNSPVLVAKAKGIHQAILLQAGTGDFFADNALRTKEGELKVTDNHSEVCQYFAFYFGTATPQSHAGLWKKLCEEFGPNRKSNNRYPQVHPANSFIGNVLRLELLSRAGRCQQVLDEAVDYNLYMADRTGTLWENIGDYASCNHGFASHLVQVLYRDVLGLYDIDPVNRRLTLRFAEIAPQWCSGRVPVPGGAISLQWTREGRLLNYSLALPAGWDVAVDNVSELRVVRQP